jgi:glucosylceramidase
MEIQSVQVLLTSEAGGRLESCDQVSFKKGNTPDRHIKIEPGFKNQTIEGIGSSFTESSAFVLAHLEPSRRQEVMENIYGHSGANFSIARTPIGSTDFSVEGKYCYQNSETSENFDISVDKDGFDPDQYPGIKDPHFDILPMIKEALDIKTRQSDSTLNIVASAWTAPPWMKDIEDWFVGGSPENGFKGTGGSLKPEHQSTYANYLIKYLKSYQQEGIPIWAITPVNEPGGNNGQWESMLFSAEAQREFIKKHLGPALENAIEIETKLLMFDHNRNDLEHWADVILGDMDAAKYIDGIAVHWYEGTFKVYEDSFNRIHNKFPRTSLIHTEGCIDDLGKDAPEGILDPVNYKESGWFDNDDFWWNCNATDWAYTATWPGVIIEDHPMYTPVHRYARNIIVSINNWLGGWIDWNIVLDRNGGPNHVGNFCGAPIMIDTDTGSIYYTPIYHILAQLSRTIRPGDRAVQTTLSLPDVDCDLIHACATINQDNLLSIQVLNTGKAAFECALKIGSEYADIEIEPNCLKTFQIQLTSTLTNNLR